MNAGILADGLRRGGAGAARHGARWLLGGRRRLPGFASFAVLRARAAQRTWHLDNNPFFLWADMLTRIWSPYQINPLNYNPLRALLERIDFEVCAATMTHPSFHLRDQRTHGLASRVRQRRTFARVLLASACLPHLYQAVEIDGELYWDGGYTGNPALAPLYLRTAATDFIIIGINPLMRADVPRTAREIINRIDEISFNSTFMLELGGHCVRRGSGRN